jgi:SAM-dependent methyltransferase
MNETSKSILRRVHDQRFATRYFVGRGIDVGAGSDSLAKYQSLFPLCTGIDSWDKAQGDAQPLAGVPNDSYDFLHSSHCLEHLIDPAYALSRWAYIVRPGGHLVVMVPDWTLYEHELWPSQHNSDHKHSFTLDQGWEPRATFLPNIIPNTVDILKLELLDATFMPQVAGDQTLGIGECAIEIILRKR